MTSKIYLPFSFQYSDQLDGKLVHLGTIGKTSWDIRPNWSGLKVISVEIAVRNNTKDVEFEVNFTFDNRVVSDLNFVLENGEESIIIPTPFYQHFYTGHELTGYIGVCVDSTSTTDRKEVTRNAPTVIDSQITNTLPQLSKDLLSMLNNPDSFTDAILNCGSDKIKAHKGILSARSPVFATMLKTKMQEGCLGSVDIVDIAPDVLLIMVKYMYSGQIDHLTDLMADPLLFAADKYQLEELKMICTNKLKEGLTRENLFRILVLGDLHDKSLKEHAMDFICQFLQFSTLEETNECKTLVADRPVLAIEVLSFIVKYQEKKLVSVEDV